MLKKYIGDRKFYKWVLAIAVPILIQNGITNFVSLLDNIMVGQVGNAEMGGVSIVNQLIMVFNLCIFGTNSGVGIFTAQFRGQEDHEGIRYTFRCKIIGGIILTVGAIALFLLQGPALIQLYLKGEGSAADAEQLLFYGREYLGVMLWGLIPFALSNMYAGTLRECGQTKVPMVAGTSAVFINLILNYILIFGHFGAPVMGVRGAALATVISRYAELAIVAGWTHLHGKEMPFIRGAYRSLYVPGKLLGKVVLRGSPLLINEFLWAAGMAALSQCYSVRSLDVVNAHNILSTMNNLVSVITMAVGNTIGILLGQMMGAKRSKEEIKDAFGKMCLLCILCGCVAGLAMILLSGLFPMLYNTTDSIRSLATQLLIVAGLFKPFFASVFAVYFALRSGGKTWVTFWFDCGFMWVVMIPLAFVLSHFTQIPIVPLYTLCQLPEILKCVLGFCLLRGGKWIQNITA